MDDHSDAARFLASRRARITPEQASIPVTGVRRAPGLRRGEVATIAGVSPEYYAKLERGALAGVSASVLDALARALQLDDAERTHLFHLAQAADGTAAAMRPRRRPSKQWTPRPALQWVLDSITAPAIVRNGRMDLLAANHLGTAMHEGTDLSIHSDEDLDWVAAELNDRPRKRLAFEKPIEAIEKLLLQ